MAQQQWRVRQITCHHPFNFFKALMTSSGGAKKKIQSGPSK